MYLNLIGSLLIGTSAMLNNETEILVKTVPEKTDWILIEEDDILTIHERWVVLQDGTKTRERKGVFCVDNQLDSAVPLVSSAEGISSWMKGVEETVELDQNDTLSKIVYILFSAPWPFKDRDLITEVKTIDNCEDSCTEIHMSAIVNYIPEREKTMRMNSYEARWKISSISEGKIEIEFIAYSATPPIAPRWIQDPVTLRLFKDNLLNLNDLLTLNE